MNKWTLFAIVALYSVWSDLSAAPRDRRMNVLFIATDDLRANLGCYGDPVAITPNIDRLAGQGVLFDRAYCQQALCNPSRASLLTGLRPDTLRVWNLPTHFRETRPDVVTLPQHFKNQGYFTQNVGKIFHNWRTKIQGDPVSWSVPSVLHFASHSMDVPEIDGGELPMNVARAKGLEARDVPDEAYFDGRVAAEAIKALRHVHTGDKPFFLGVGFWKPHAPFNAPKRYWDLYRRGDIPAVTNPSMPAGAPGWAAHTSAEGLATIAHDPEAMRELRHGYYAAISYLDVQVGKVIDELDRLGLTDSTIVVFWSDHGFHLGEHGLWGKTSNFELDARVPLIISAPGFPRGGRSSSLVELLDIYPTLVDLCGLPAVEGLEGLSMKPVLRDGAATIKAAAFTQHTRPSHTAVPGEVMGYSMRTDHYRYTEWREWGSGLVLGIELYDHDTDADETSNQAGSLSHWKAQRDLAAQLGIQFPRKSLPPK